MTTRSLTLLAALLPAAIATAQSGTVQSDIAQQANVPARAPVLAHVDHPHSYYWREMYIPQLTSGPGQAAFTPDGKALLYSMAGSLWRQALDSDEAWQLTAGPGYDYQPEVSPDGRYAIYTRADGDALELWRLDLDSLESRQLTRTGAANLEPRISPDGKRVVFTSSRDGGHFNLFIAELGESGLGDVRPLLAPRQSDIDRYYYGPTDHAINPSWSPDGTRIYYLANTEVAWGSGDLWSVAVDNPANRQKILVEETTWAAKPEMAPDGKRLLYASYQGRQWHQLWLTTPSGQSPLPLTFGEFDLRQQRWSPDGEQIVYISNEAGGTELWLQTVIGGERKRIAAKQRHYLQPMTQLTLQLAGPDGKPIAGRVMVQDASGRHYGAEADAHNNGWLHGDDYFQPGQQSHENHYFHCQKRCELQVPQGEITVTALHGFATAPAQQTLTVAADSQTLNLLLGDLSLPRKFGPHQSADLHLHMNYGGHYRQQLAGLADQMSAEDLDIGYNLIVNKEQRIPDIAAFSTAPFNRNGRTIFQGQEYHTSYWGHLGLLHLDDHYLTPDFASYRHTALASPYPHNGAVSELAHKQGALVGYVHPFDWSIDPAKEKKLSHSLPADAALGLTDYLEVVSFADHKATAEVWYRLLNLGLRLPAGAGTDAMTNYASLRGPVGLNRIFLQGAARDADSLKRAIREGQSFVSNGPMLGLRVNGQLPGHSVRLQQPGKVKVDAALRSLVPLEDLELVFNGAVIKRLTAGQRVDWDGEVEIPGSGWLLLRAAGQPHPWVQDLYPYATTNPVWLEVDGAPQRAPEDAAYFTAWLDRVIDDASQRDEYLNDNERERTLAYLHKARAFYAARAE
ncbi:CehA/McbA family metallohydrolase [Microbulbifer pacificus]|uniref:CehA/McbA family metallohydrolase n=1 Tax=Microbulbifer pacificus TaxID=407164 RepID=A0AAU0N2P5_9GAMM|nr:CehA/McbA family metallohydrolase [Microbulbifer pacificus]WOX07227.1 CehA/McbA family metallohydrolase [Microbulbifer pacificus]